MGHGLVAVQIALSFVLVLGSMLFVRTFVELTAQPMGFSADRVLIAGIDLRRTGTKPILTGRDVSGADIAGRPAVALVNEAFARKFLSGQNPVGRTLVTIDFTNTIIIMTSNIGSHHITAARDDESIKEAVMTELKAAFRPELLNRLDETVVFHQLGREQLRSIVDIQLGRFRKRLEAREITLEVTPEAKDLLGNLGYDPTYGARPLKRVLQRQLENPLAEAILAGKLGGGDTAVVSATRDGALSIDRRAGETAIPEHAVH
jgi:hypothetical protein